MRLISILTGLLMAAAGLAVVPSSASADTGGGTVFFHHAKRAYRAPAAHPEKRTALARPRGVVSPGVLTDVKPSPDGRLVAQIWDVVQFEGGVYGTRVVVSDRNGRHARVVWVGRDRRVRGTSTSWRLDGMNWGKRIRGGVQFYFAPVRSRIDRTTNDGATTTSRLMTSVIPPKRRPKAAAPVKGGAGLVSPTVDRNTGRLAALRLYEPICDDSGCTIASTIELLNPRNGNRRDLLHVSTPIEPGVYTSPLADLAWSPDGSQIAFQQSTCCARPDGGLEQLRLGEIGVVAADGSDGDRYRVAVPYDGRHLVESPTWRGPHSLWFARGVRDDRIDAGAISTPADLYSVSVRGRRIGPLVQRSHTTFAEDGPSFG
jgi:hypothetical protein